MKCKKLCYTWSVPFYIRRELWKSSCKEREDRPDADADGAFFASACCFTWGYPSQPGGLSRHEQSCQAVNRQRQHLPHSLSRPLPCILPDRIFGWEHFSLKHLGYSNALNPALWKRASRLCELFQIRRLFHKNPPSRKGDSQPFRERIFSFYETEVTGKDFPFREGGFERIPFPARDGSPHLLRERMFAIRGGT